MKERKKLSTKTGKAETGQRRVGNLLGGQANWRAYIFLQIRQRFRVHSSWGTWPKSKRYIQNPTTRQTDREKIKKKSISQQSSTVGSEFTGAGKVSRQPLFHDDCWIWRDKSKGQLKKERWLDQQQTLPIWEGCWTKHISPCAPMDTKNQKQF